MMNTTRNDRENSNLFSFDNFDALNDLRVRQKWNLRIFICASISKL